MKYSMQFQYSGTNTMEWTEFLFNLLVTYITSMQTNMQWFIVVYNVLHCIVLYWLVLFQVLELDMRSIYWPVASRTTLMSVALPRPERSRMAETIFRYRLSNSSRVLARLSVISRTTGCMRWSRTRWCSSKNSPAHQLFDLNVA